MTTTTSTSNAAGAAICGDGGEGKRGHGDDGKYRRGDDDDDANVGNDDDVSGVYFYPGRLRVFSYLIDGVGPVEEAYRRHPLPFLSSFFFFSPSSSPSSPSPSSS